MTFIPSGPVSAMLWKKENVDLFAFYNIPTFWMRFTCQLFVKKYKYSNSVMKG